MEGWAQPGNKRPKAKNPLANNAQFFLAAFILKGFFYWFDSNKRRILDSFCFLRSMWLVVLSLGLCNRSAVQSQKERTKKSTEIWQILSPSQLLLFFFPFLIFSCVFYFLFSLNNFFYFFFFPNCRVRSKLFSFFLSFVRPAAQPCREGKKETYLFYT